MPFHGYNSLIHRFCLSTDVLALLLSDSLVFLQEKDQKYIFAAVVGFYYYTISSSQILCVLLLKPSVLRLSLRTRSLQWSPCRSWSYERWPTRREACFWSAPLQLGLRCMRCTLPLKMSETPGWDSSGKLWRSMYCSWMISFFLVSG